MYTRHGYVVLVLGLALTLATHGTAGTDTVVQQDSEEEDEQAVYCPSYCDDNGIYHVGKYCLGGGRDPFCCLIMDQLKCCPNRSSSVSEQVKDEYNCHDDAGWLSYYWKTILGVCLPLALISVIGAVTLCSIQNVRTRRRQRQLAQMERERSNSAVSTISGTSSSCSRHTSSFRAPPSPIVVVTSRHESPNLEYLRVHGLRYPLEPPPYSNDKPPTYSDIMMDLDGSFTLDTSWPVDHDV